MPYNDKHTLLIDCLKTPYGWCDMKTLQDDIKQLEGCLFYSPLHRKVMRKIVQDMCRGSSQLGLEPFFDLHDRFPACLPYVHLYAPKYVKAILGMHMALDIENEHEENNLPEDLAANKTAFYHHLTKLKKGLAKAKHVYDRALFEEKFNLTWHDD
ncbi:hypothetical protein BD560DRAFT_438336 [Blakeslea trispora]|nr:hypothetical protein BD560DRAFT_438336 [Blakeslea trispora]